MIRKSLRPGCYFTSRTVMVFYERTDISLPKRIGYLYEELCQIEQVHDAFHNAIRRKKSHPSDFTRLLIESEDALCEAIQYMMEYEIYEPSTPHCFKVVDGISGKVRDVQAPQLCPDQIIHWNLMLTLDRVIMKGMYAHSCGSIPGRGPSHAKRYLEKKLRSPGGTSKYKFCLKMDIHHFFQSIDQDILVLMFRRKIKDKKMLALIEAIIYSVQEGLPIGYYTSQWFSNFYLEAFDHFVKEELKVDCYVRYVDDIVICGSNKRKLHRICDRIAEYLWDNLHLKLKDNYQVFRVAVRGIDFCGFRFYHDRTGIRKAILINIARANRKLDGPATKHALASMISYYGWLDQTDTYVYMKRNLTGSKQNAIRRFKILDKAGLDSEVELMKLKRNSLLEPVVYRDLNEKALVGAL